MSKYNLKNIDLDEISLVDRPANPDAKVALWKRDSNESGDTAGDNAGSPGTNQNPEVEMTPEELEKKLGDLEEQVAKKDEDNAKLSADIEALTKSIEEAGLKVEKSDDGIKVEKAAEPEYIEVNGEKVEKSAIPEPLLKQMEAQQEAIEKMQADQEREALAKRADSELPNLKGTNEEKGALLKAVDGIDDEDTRKKVAETLKAADAAASKVFEEVGKSATEDESSASYKLEKMARDHQVEKGVTYEQAFAEVVKTAEGKELRKEAAAEAN